MRSVFHRLGFLVSASLLVVLGACGGGGGTSNPPPVLTTNHPPVTLAPSYLPADPSLSQFKTYTFTTSATDPDIGNSIVSYEWDFGDLSAHKLTSSPSVAYIYVNPGTYKIQVRAVDNLGLAGDYTGSNLTVVAAPSPYSVTPVAPAAPATRQILVGSSISVSFSFTVSNTGTTPLVASSIVLNPGDPGATVGTAVNNGGGNWSVTVSYPGAAAPGLRTATPTVQVIDPQGVTSSVVSFPALTLQTGSAIDHAPVISLNAVPKILASANATWQGVPIAFSATASDPDLGDTLSYSWTFSDGGSGDISNSSDVAVLSQTHTYLTPGIHVVTFTADDGWPSGKKSINLSLNILANGAPTLTALQSPLGDPFAFVPVTFTATAKDPNNDPLLYSWDFGDGTVIAANANPVATHSFQAAGVSIVTLTADDSKGGVTTWTAQVNVKANQRPVTTLTTPAGKLLVNKPYTFTANAVDPDPGDTIAQYQWDFNEVPKNLYYSTTPTISHTFTSAQIGVKAVSVCAVDSRGGVGDFSQAVNFTLTSSLPVASFLSPAAAQTVHVSTGGNVIVSYVVKATNPNGTGNLPITAVSLNPGNGAAASYSKDNLDGTYVFQFPYAAGALGSVVLTPTVTVTDGLGVSSDPGAASALTVQTVAAANTPPQVTSIPFASQFISTPPDPTVVFQAPGNNATWTGVAITFAGVITLDADGDPLAATWDFGDGTAPVTTYNNTVSVPPVTHTYSSDGYFNVKLTLDDGRGNGIKWLNATPGVTVLAHDSVQSITIATAAAPNYAWVAQPFTLSVLGKTGQPYPAALVRWHMGDLMPAVNSINYLTDINIVNSLNNSLTLPWSAYGVAAAPGQDVQLSSLNGTVSWAYPPRGLTQVTATAYDGMGGVVTSNSLAFTALNAPAPVTSLVTAPGTFYRGNACVFIANAVASPGLLIANYAWDFGDGTPLLITVANTVTHTYTSTGTMNVRVFAIDSAGTAGAYTAASAFTILPATLPVVTFMTPVAPVSADVIQGNTFTQVFTVSVSNPQGGAGATITAANLTFAANDAFAGTPVVASLGANTFSITVIYPPVLIPGSRTSVPTCYATDSFGVRGGATSGPAVTINSIGIPPTLTITAPASSPFNLYMLTPLSLQFTAVDPVNVPLTYTIDWGDNSTKTVATLDPAAVAPLLLSNGIPVLVQHAYTAPGTYVIKADAVDTRTSYNVASTRSTTVIALANAYPTATINSPQASGTLPTPVELASNLATGLINPPTATDPDLVVIPLNGSLLFKGSTTLTTSGEALGGVNWTFQGGVPSTDSSNPPAGINVIFPGVAGAITPYLVEFVATDIFHRVSNDPAAGAKPKAYRKWVIVDGIHTQNFNLTFLYRQKADNNGAGSLTPVVTKANGLGALINIYQDGASYPFNVASANQATVNIPVRSNLPFYLKIPTFNGSDPISYMMRIPNATTGPDADPTLLSSAYPHAADASTFAFTGNGGTTDPALAIVTAQGFAAETAAADARKMQGMVSFVDPITIKNERWIDRLSVPNTDAWLQFTHSTDVVGGFSGMPANQSFAEWPILLKAWTGNYLSTDDPLRNPATDPTSAAGKAADLGFNLNYGNFTSNGKLSLTYAIESMEAYRVPAGVTDPYDLSTAPANWNLAPVAVNLRPTEMFVNAGETAFFSNMVFGDVGGTPLAGGMQNFGVPFDPNDKDRKVTAPVLRPFLPFATTFSYAEYLWSKVWARPLVLNSAELAYIDSWSTGIRLFPYFRYSDPLAWPIYDTPGGNAPMGIPEADGSLTTFNLTARGAGAFAATAPIGTQGTHAQGTGVGHFFWTAFTPFYDANGGAMISRTWLGNDANGKPPTAASFNGAVGDATAAVGFLPPVNVVVDKRSRDAHGAVLLPETLGGYRVTWFNPTTDSTGAVVAPDFWVVEVTLSTGEKDHYLLPAGFPVNQDLSNLILTDSRIFQSPGGLAHAAPFVPGDTLAPGYCWFDIVPELRPPTGGSATVTVFALKSILKNQPPGLAMPRPLNRTDWIDAVKTATATMAVNPGGSDLTYAHKVPFNYAWDIVVVNGPGTPVAP